MAEQTLDTITELIAIESTADKPQQLARALDQIIRILSQAKGINVEKFDGDGRPSLLAYAGPTRPQRFRVILNGHLDVVAAQPTQFKPRVSDGKLFGRGALDMKSTVVIMAEVFCALAGKLPYPLGLQIVTDEEVGGHHGTKVQVKQGVRADLAISGEFTPRAAICTESRGMFWAEVEFKGKTAHSAYTWKGENALLKMPDFMRRLLQQYPMPKSESWATTANVAYITTPNTTFNLVPDSALLAVDIRYIPEDKVFATQESAVAFLKKLQPGIKVKVPLFEPGHQADAQHPLIQGLAHAVTQVAGHKATFLKKQGASDARYYSELGDQAVNLGLQGENLHGDDEYVDIKSLEEYRAILTTFLQNARG